MGTKERIGLLVVIIVILVVVVATIGIRRVLFRGRNTVPLENSRSICGRADLCLLWMSKRLGGIVEQPP